MRILYITNGFPYPMTSGYLRHYYLIRGLARRHAVTLVSLVGGTFRPEHADALEPYTTRVLTFGEANPREARLDPALDSRARQFVEQNFVWSRSTSHLDALLASLAVPRIA